jgi:hypothetical protein
VPDERLAGMADIVIAVAICILTLGTAYMGVHVTLHAPSDKAKQGWKVAFWLAAVLICALIGWQTERSVKSQESLQSQLKNLKPPTADENAAAVVKLEKEQQQTSALSHAPDIPRPRHEGPAPKPANPQTSPAKPSPAPDVAHLTVTQTSEISDRPETPYRIRVIVQSSIDFPSLRLAVECDGPITDGSGGSGMMMMTSQGIVSGHPNVYVLTYQTSTPPFGPANPFPFTFYSKEPIKCTRASIF